MVKENGFSKIGWCAPFVRNASYVENNHFIDLQKNGKFGTKMR